jgi:hypothetical protein
MHKGNDPTDPNNYRGITITGAIGKVFNRVLSLRLYKFLPCLTPTFSGKKITDLVLNFHTKFTYVVYLFYNIIKQKKNLIYLIHTVKTGVSLSTQVKLKFLFSIRQADLLIIVLGMEIKILNVYTQNLLMSYICFIIL